MLVVYIEYMYAIFFLLFSFQNPSISCRTRMDLMLIDDKKIFVQVHKILQLSSLVSCVPMSCLLEW